MKTLRKNNKPLIAVIALAILLAIFLIAGVTGAIYKATRQVGNTLILSNKIVIEYDGFEHVTEDADNIWQKNEAEFKLFLDSELLPGESIEIAPATIKAGEGSIDFYARFKLDYKFYSDLEGTQEVEVDDYSKIINESDELVASAWVEAADGYYYYANRTTLNTFTPDGNEVELFADGASYLLNSSITGAGPGYVVDENTTILCLDVILTLEVAQVGTNWEFELAPTFLTPDNMTFFMKDENDEIVSEIEEDVVYSIVDASGTGLQYIFTKTDASTLSSAFMPENVVGTAVICGYTGELTELFIYDYVNLNGELYLINEIGEYAFSECYSLTEVTIPNKIATIGECAFAYVDCIETVYIGSGVHTIGSEAFSEAGIYNLTIESAVIIGPDSFYGNYITNLVVPEGTIEIGDGAFCWNSELTSVEFPTTLNKIGEYAFSYCGLINLEVPDNVTTILEGAFDNCESLETAKISNAVTEIPNMMFENDIKLVQVTLGENTTSIGLAAFAGCVSLPNITIPNSVDTINDRAFAGCVGLDYFVSNGSTFTTLDEGNLLVDGAKLVAFAPAGIEEYIIPDTITTVGISSFAGSKNLLEVEIPETVTIIEPAAFQACESLTNINLPTGLDILDNYVFDGCASLESIELPEITEIGYAALRGCSTLVTIDIPDSVEIISKYAFSTCTSLENIVIPYGVQILENNVFEKCTSLVGIEIPETVTEIAGMAFSGCTVLSEIELPENLQTLGGNAFRNCTSITNLDIPNSVTSIGANAFYGCSELLSITIPDGVTTIKAYLFYGCQKLESVRIGSGAKTFETYIFQNCTALKNLIIVGNASTIINTATCSGATNLEYFELGNGSINVSAFSNRIKLSSVTLGEGVTEVKASAFQGCTSLTSMTINRATPPTITSTALPANTVLTAIYVPEGAIDAYEEDSVLGSYNIYAIE